MTAPLDVVWFKRDFRVADHQPLSLASARGPVLPLYVAEPGLWAQPDASARQWAFAAESLLWLPPMMQEVSKPMWRVIECGLL